MQFKKKTIKNFRILIAFFTEKKKRKEKQKMYSA